MKTALLVGAGIGGPVLAMFLKRLGMDVTLVESRESVAQSEGAFLGVAPNGMNVLDDLGLAEGLPGGHACKRFEFRNAADKNIGEIDRSQDKSLFKWPLTMVRRGELHAYLANAAQERGVKIHHGKRMTQCLPLPSGEGRGEGMSAEFTDRTTLTANFIIGADGLRSTTRKLILPNAPEPKFSGLLDFGGFAKSRSPNLEPNVNYMVFGRRAFFGAFPTPDGETWWFHNGPPGESLLELHKDDPSWISDLIKATPQILGPWQLHDLRSMPRWTEGRVALLGDAAHAMSPSAGQGASLAMEDAMVLAQCLRDIDDVPRAFQTYERLRRPRVDAIAKHAARQSNNKAPTRMSEWFRDRMLPFFLRFGAKSQTQSYEFRIDWQQRVTTP
jgi:2-polyprenyl-6-methoxyphenol hydroxylase-like FAD-dependent oxidoreductase